MKRIQSKPFAIIGILVSIMFLLSACGKTGKEIQLDIVEIELGEDEICVNGIPIETSSDNAVYAAKDIVYYEDGTDFTYGEGSEKDAHGKEEALAHTVVHITEPGTYSLSGTLQLGQIAVDLGAEAKADPEAIVTLILNGVDITCEVAPAVIFYHVYECGSSDIDSASEKVDTSRAGANVIIADDTTNTINGSYVEKIYKPDSVVLNENKTEVVEAKKLHKYDGAFYSRMSMNINGEEKNSGILNINAKNEGLDSELHLTINGGNINIRSGNDGINTNEDGLSVTTVNGGTLSIQVTGETGEGDGIDSNGWLVINGGKVMAFACSDSQDAGIDSDMGIYINGGTVIASGHMLDRIEGGQTYAVFSFSHKQNGNEMFCLKDKRDKVITEITLKNAYSVLVYSSSDLEEGTYSLWVNDKQMAGQSGGMMMGGPGMLEMRPEGFDGMKHPEGFEGMQPPTNTERPERPNEEFGKHPGPNKENMGNIGDLTPEFQITDGANLFGNVSPVD